MLGSLMGLMDTGISKYGSNVPPVVLKEFSDLLVFVRHTPLDLAR
jgi:hypothetical protein